MFETPTPPSELGPSQEWSMTYLKSICGILKIAEMVLSLVGFICAVSFPGRAWGEIGWTTFVCIAGFLIAVASFVIHIINYFPRHIVACIIELIIYAVWTLFFLIAGIVSAVAADRVHRDYGSAKAAAGAASFFCFVCLLMWAADTVLQFMAWNRKRQEPVSSTGPQTATTTTSASDAPTY